MTRGTSSVGSGVVAASAKSEAAEVAVKGKLTAPLAAAAEKLFKDAMEKALAEFGVEWTVSAGLGASRHRQFCRACVWLGLLLL